MKLNILTKSLIKDEVEIMIKSAKMCKSNLSLSQTNFPEISYRSYLSLRAIINTLMFEDIIDVDTYRMLNAAIYEIREYYLNN